MLLFCPFSQLNPFSCFCSLKGSNTAHILVDNTSVCQYVGLVSTQILRSVTTVFTRLPCCPRSEWTFLCWDWILPVNYLFCLLLFQSLWLLLDRTEIVHSLLHKWKIAQMQSPCCHSHGPTVNSGSCQLRPNKHQNKSLQNSKLSFFMHLVFDCWEVSRAASQTYMHTYLLIMIFSFCLFKSC